MSDGDKAHKLVLLKAEVPEQVAAELDQKAKELGYSTRAKLIRHIIGRFLRPEVSFDEFENITTPPHGEPTYSRGVVDLSPELQAALQTLNKSLDLTAAQTSIIARQNETIHRLVGQNEQLTQVLTAGNDHPALPELSRSTQEQTQTPPEVAEERTEPEPVTQGTGPTQTETVPEQPKDKQPLPGGETVDVPGSVKMGKDMGVSYSVDTVRRAVKEGILIAVPDHSPMLVYVRDVRAFAETYQKYGKLPKMPQIRDGKALE